MNNTDRKLGAGGGRILVDVDNGHCHLYAICEQEAPDVFRVTGGRLRYSSRVGKDDLAAARSAARLCPMQAIIIREDVQ